MTTALQLLSFGLAIICYSVTQLIMHQKLKWQTKGFGFFGEDSFLRKYKNIHAEKGKFQVAIPEHNLWYYELFNVKYREAFPLSATLLTFVTDFYHATQSLMFVCFALSLSLSTHINFFFLWPSIVLAHAVTYRILSK